MIVSVQALLFEVRHVDRVHGRHVAYIVVDDPLLFLGILPGPTLSLTRDIGHDDGTGIVAHCPAHCGYTSSKTLYISAYSMKLLPGQPGHARGIMMANHLRAIASTGDKCGEAATWSAAEAVLYWCDINRFVIHRVDGERRVTSWFFDEPVVALSVMHTPGELLVALASRLIVWRPADDSRRDHHFHLNGWPEVRLNDGRAAPNGDFWVGSMGNHLGPNGEAKSGDIGCRGVLYRIQQSGEVTEEKTAIGCSNTVCWSPDHRTFYFGDSTRNVIWAYDYDPEKGTISNERPFLEGFARGSPDGSAVDERGRLWNCRFGGGCVVCVAPDGSIEQVVDLPTKNVTTCAFGGPDLKTLYITTASIWTSDADRLAGTLFAYSSDVAGIDSFKATC